LDVRDLDGLTRFVGALDDVAGDQVLETAAGKRLALAGFDELGLQAHVRHAVDQHLEVLADILRGAHGVAISRGKGPKTAPSGRRSRSTAPRGFATRGCPCGN